MMLWLMFAATLALAGSTPAAEVHPRPGPPARDFDFWVGEWEVFDSHGAKAGDSSITLEAQGSLLVERWRSAGGGRGQSYSFVDPASGLWRQVFYSSWGTKDLRGGLDDKGQMVMAGTIAYANGVTAPFRATWTAHADGSVTQRLQELDGATETWDDWFVGTYRRRGAATRHEKPVCP